MIIRTFLFMFFTVKCLSVFSQDIILLKNTNTISSKIINIEKDTIKYKKYNDLSGQIIGIAKNQVNMIQYENGEKEYFTETDIKTEKKTEEETTEKKTEESTPEQTGPEPVTNTFRSDQLINIQTSEIADGLEFKIQHRFGKIDEDAVYNFFGLDLSSNIRFALSYPVLENKLEVEIGRTKSGKEVDMSAKYRILHQTEKNEIPLSLSFFASAYVAGEKFPTLPVNAFFADSVTPFEYRFAHRVNYYYQLCAARKFNNKLSFQISPLLVYKNLAEPGTDNHTLALNAGGKFKFSRKSSVLLEYGYSFNNRDSATVNPLSLAFETGTPGHVFQIVLSSSGQITGNRIYTTQNADYIKGEFYLGFNIKRTW